MDQSYKLKNKFYVTTPIYYVTAKPHLGSLYSTILADVASRYNKLKGKHTFMLTGTDEHGQKIAQAAHQANKEPKEFVNSFIDAYKNTWHEYNIEYNNFIRTTDKAHIEAVQEWLKDLIDKGDIYKSHYQGWYCTPCETFVTEIGENSPMCPDCKRKTEIVSEESYFFRLSKYQEKLLKFYAENPDFITPKERLNEVISFVQSGLKDLSISRTTVSWGIPFPNDKKHVTYVWADALNNYLTGVGYKKNKEEFNFWWPADLQVLGKDIVRFHAVYWPAFLMASDLKLPKKLLVHGWIKVNQEKMSKSRGNVIDPNELLDKYGADQIRFYLVKHMATTQDSEFSIESLEKYLNAELANELGNLLNRLVTLAHSYKIYDIKSPAYAKATSNLTWQSKEIELRDKFWSILALFNQEMEDGYYYRAYNALWKFIAELNSYFHNQEPWKVAKTDIERFKEIISATAHGLYSIAILVWPVMPNKMEELLHSLGINLEVKTDKNIIEELSSNPWNKDFMLNKIPALFKKIEIEKIENKNNKSNFMENKEKENKNYITIDDVIKVELKVGTIIEVEDLEKSDKLYKLKVDLGEENPRQILAGIKKYYTAEELLNKQGIFVANLKPRKLMGIESQGMMLLAEDANGGLKMATVESKVPNGTRLK